MPDGAAVAWLQWVNTSGVIGLLLAITWALYTRRVIPLHDLDECRRSLDQ